MAQVTSKEKKINRNFSQNRIQFNENDSGKMTFEPIPVHTFLTDDVVQDLRTEFISASFGYNDRRFGPPYTRGPRGGKIPVPDTNLLDNGYDLFKRLGRYVGGETVEVTSNIPEGSDVGGTRIGRQTIFGDSQDISTNDGQRQGLEVKNLKHFDKKLIPLVRIPLGGSMFSYDDVIQHIFGGEESGYGQGLEFKIYDENFNLIPFKDFGKLVPKDLLGKRSVVGYPIVHDTVQNFEQYVDPSYAGYDGAIDLFMTRQSIINSSYDYIPYGLKGDYQAGGIEELKRGSIEIDSKFSIKNGSNEFYLDSQELEFSNYLFEKGVRTELSSSSGYKFSLPGLISDERYKLSPYQDENYLKYNNSKYTFLDNNAKSILLKNSDNDVSEIGQRFKASNCGLIFGESNVLGTDSIAFGGLKK